MAFIDHEIADHPYDPESEDHSDSERAMFPDRDLPYILVRTLRLDKVILRDAKGAPFSMPLRSWLGEPYEYRNVLDLRKRCTAYLSHADWMGTTAYTPCLNLATHKATHHMGYPLDGPNQGPGANASWAVCTRCADEDDLTTFVPLDTNRRAS